MAGMTDRLSELGRRDRSPEPEEEREVEGPGLESFFVSVDEMGRNIDEIELKLDEIRQVQNDIITKPAGSNKVYKERHNELMEEVKVLSQKVHRGLKRLDEEIKQDELGPNRHTAEFRIKKGQSAALSQKLKKVMLAYNQLEEQHREKCKKAIKRQLKTVDPNSQEPDDDKIEELLESPELSVFTQDILAQTAQKRQALDEVEARKKEILQLEANIQELHDMFYDMMLLVESQGDLIDLIQHNVENAAVYVSKGTEETTKARVYASKNRRLRWVICAVVTGIIVVIIIAIVIAAAIGASVVRNNSGATARKREIWDMLMPSHDSVE